MERKDLLEYFIKTTDARFDKIDKKLDDLNSWKFKIIGGSIAISFIITIFIKMIFNT